MNENINLCELLKGHEGETFYIYGIGNAILKHIDEYYDYPIYLESLTRDDFNNPQEFCFTSKGTIWRNTNDIVLFPSKDQRDWNKWTKEQNSKVPKTWNELVNAELSKDIVIHAGLTNAPKNEREYVEVLSFDLPIEKAALALLKIHQLIEVGYGGNITNEEWEDDEQEKYVIGYNHGIITGICYNERNHIAFHTEKQRDEFLSYPENVQLIRDFYQI